MTDHEKHDIVRDALIKRGFGEYTKYPELRMAIIDAAEHLAKMLIKEKK